jgi:molybdate transport system substrate-binding protein
MRVLSSMATRALLGELAERYTAAAARPVAVESIGGVDAAKRIRNGEVYDVVVLASDVIDALSAEGAVLAGSRVDVARSPVAVAVRAGAPLPDISSGDAVRAAVMAARTIGYSTGPSGSYLGGLFERWGIADAVKSRLVVAPPGVPVGSLVARGEIELGFQQLSELSTLEGITVVGPLPADIQYITVFAGGVVRAGGDHAAARDVLAFMGSPEVADVKRRHGMEPAS